AARRPCGALRRASGSEGPLLMPDLILSRIADLVCTITLNRPEKRNALSTEMIEALHATLAQVAAREDVRVVVLASAGGVFCAGLDLRELAAQREAGRVETHPLQDALESLERCPHPTIAAVQGDAIAGGCELALHCDLRVAPPGSLEAAVGELARQIAHNAPLSVRAMKAFVQRLAEERRAYRRDELEALFHRVQGSADAREGLAAQRERRSPVFRGE